MGQQPELEPWDELPPLPLIGHGLDAIIWQANRPHDNFLMRLIWPAGVNSPERARPRTPEERIARYHDALGISGVMLDEFEARERSGEILQHEWKLGRRPNLTGKHSARRPNLRSVA